MIYLCKHCGKEIPEGRIKALPKTETCVDCSNVGKKLGFQVVTGKTTYTELDIVDEKTYKDLTRKQARRGQSPGGGIQMGKGNSLRKDFSLD